MTAVRTRRKPIRGIGAIDKLNVFQLAHLAGSADPDEGRTRYRRKWSAGAKLLVGVRDAVVEGIRDESITETNRDNSGQLSEIADGAPNIYTATRWAEFVDLGAYMEEPECEEWADDLTQAAAQALYQIADRLCHALVDAWIEARS